METLGYYNGKIGPLEDMMIPMNDRGCYFGDGIYEAGPCRHYRIFALDEHVDRLFRSAEEVDIQVPMEKDELKATLQELVHRLDSDTMTVYYQVTRGTGLRNHIYERCPGNLWITLRPLTLNECRKPLKLITTEDIRFLRCDVKTLNLLPAVMASQKAHNAGCDEAVFYREGGRVTECAHSNVHILKDGVLHTAPLDNLILPGVARHHLLMACEKLGIPVKEEPFYLPELYDADEILVTSSSKFCCFADEIDGRPVANRSQDLVEALRSEVLREFYACTE